MKQQLKQIFFSGILCINFLSSIIGQSDTYELADILTTEDGLSHNYVTCLSQYEIGLLAIGTQNGMQVYDGYDFQIFDKNSPPPFTLNDNNFNSIEVDTKGYVWVASTNGINKVYPFKGENIQFFNKGNSEYPSIYPERGANTSLVNTLDGKMWIVNNGIICRLIDGKVKKYFPEKFNTVTKIIGDSESNIYAFTDTALIALTPEGQLLFEVNEFVSPLYGKLDRTNISNLFDTKSGEIILEDFENKRFFKVNPSGLFEDITIENHWVPRLFHALYEQVIFYKIKSLQVFDFVVTDHNLIWVATNFGLAKVIIRNDNFEKIPELEGVSIRAMHASQDGLVYGGTFAPNQFFCYNPISKKIRWIPNNVDVTDMISLNRDSLLIISSTGKIRIFSKSKKKIVTEIEAPKDSKLKKIFIDKSNTIWFGGVNNIFKSQIESPLQLERINVSNEDFIFKNLVRDFCQNTDSTFFLATDNGILDYHKKNGTTNIYNNLSPKSLRPLDNIIGQFIKDASGDIWIATDGGLNFFDIQKGKITKSYSYEDGLVDNLIYSMVLESDSILWLGTGNGLSRFDTKNESFSNYLKKDGLTDNEFNSNSFAKDSDGKIYMGTIKGVTIIDPWDFPKQKKTSTHFVAKYDKYNSKTGEVRSFFLNPNKITPIHLRPNEKYIEFYFVNGDYTNPRRNKFSYFLDGYEKKWVPLSPKNYTRYSNLPAGKYIFKLRSTNANGVENDFVFEVPIIVEQHFYQSFIFKIFIWSALLLAFFAFLNARQSARRKQYKLRNKLARDLHDEMSNTFNNIRIIAKESNSNNQKKSEKDFSIINQMSNDAIQMVEDVIWSLDRKNYTVGDVIFKLEDFLDDVLRAKNIPVKFVRDTINEDGRLNYLYRRNLLLIFKEAITNVIKHSKPTLVEILFRDDGDSIYYGIKNHFEKLVDAKYSTGLGISGMRQRAELINAKIEFKETPHFFEIVMVMKKKRKRSFRKKK